MNKYELVVQNEAFLLGCILKDSSLMDESQLELKHFVNLKNREVYKAMQEVRKEGQEISTISLAQLGETVSMKYGGTKYLAELVRTVPSIHSFHSYQKNILNFHAVQQTEEAVNEFLEATKETYNIKEVANLIQKVNKLEAETVKNQQSYQQLLAQRVEYHFNSPKSGLSGVDAGFLTLNRYTDGWQHGDLIIIGARPSMGKTALVLNSLLNATKKANVMGTLFSIEMAKEQIIDRLLASEGRINLMKMRNPNKTFTESDWNKHSKAVQALYNLNLDIRDESTVPEIRAAIRRNVKQYPDKKHVVAIDFLTLIRAVKPSGNTHIDITEIILDLKQTAKDLGVPIIVLAQLSRGIEQRQDKRPTMSDIRESGSIEQTADVVAFLYRDEYYNPETENKGVTEIIIAKNRNGSTGTVKMRFVKETNTFMELI